MEEFNSEWFINRLHDRSARGLARQISALIQSGALPVGTRLPAILDLAFGLGISPATVSIAWTDLRKRGIIPDGADVECMYATCSSLPALSDAQQASVAKTSASI